MKSVADEMSNVIKNVRNPDDYRIAQRRIIDMRFKAPMRFRRIICELYGNE